MAADPTRAALEAAALEISARHLEWDGKPPEVWDGRRHMAAAAVAAFLRALPYHLILTDTRGRPVCSGAQWLAAAVEAAGREGE